MMMKKAATATFLLALVAAAAAVTTTDAATMTMPDDVGGGRRHRRGPSWRDRQHGGGRRSSPLAGLTECVTACGSGVTRCMLDCYPGDGGWWTPSCSPVCLLKCTNDAMVCGSACATNLI